MYAVPRAELAGRNPEFGARLIYGFMLLTA
jgi:hypothetical protein